MRKNVAKLRHKKIFTMPYLKLVVIQIRFQTQDIDSFWQRPSFQLFVTVSRFVNVLQLGENFLHQNLLPRLASILTKNTIISELDSRPLHKPRCEVWPRCRKTSRQETGRKMSPAPVRLKSHTPSGVLI